MEIELKNKTYEELQQELVECILKSRAYEKALDKACHVIGELNDCTNIGTDAYRKCPFFDECNKDRFNGCISNNEKWKEWLLND